MDLSTKVWGPSFWSMIHFIALGYPEKPSNQDKMNYKSFYMNLENVLPCNECVKHYKGIIKKTDIADYLETNMKLFEWTVLIHNEVNKFLNKPILSVDEAKNIYTKPSFMWNKSILVGMIAIVIIIGMMSILKFKR